MFSQSNSWHEDTTHTDARTQADLQSTGLICLITPQICRRLRQKPVQHSIKRMVTSKGKKISGKMKTPPL